MESRWKGIDLDDSPRVQETIKCKTLDGLLLKYAPETTFFDFPSLDVEGAEVTILESIDFDRTNFGIIFVEADEHSAMKTMCLRKFLELNGYYFLLSTNAAIGL